WSSDVCSSDLMTVLSTTKLVLDWGKSAKACLLSVVVDPSFNCLLIWLFSPLVVFVCSIYFSKSSYNVFIKASFDINVDYNSILNASTVCLFICLLTNRDKIFFITCLSCFSFFHYIIVKLLSILS